MKFKESVFLEHPTCFSLMGLLLVGTPYMFVGSNLKHRISGRERFSSCFVEQKPQLMDDTFFPPKIDLPQLSEA